MKYMGSKQRISKELEPILTMFLTNERYYVEPFCGGMNMICNIEHNKRIASDINNYLIAMWRYICQGYDFPKTISKELYSEYRLKFNKNGFNGNGDTIDEAMIGWIGFMGSFNGRFYDGGYSGHNVNGRDYISEQIKNTLSQVEKLKGVEFMCGNYNLIGIPNDSIIYCDIPYKGTKQYSSSKNFNHDLFWEWCRKKTNEGNVVFISEYQAPQDFSCIWSKEITNSMNTTKTYKPTEKLFIHNNILNNFYKI